MNSKQTAHQANVRGAEVIDLVGLEKDFAELTGHIRDLPVARDVPPGTFTHDLEHEYRFDAPVTIEQIVSDVQAWLDRGNVHTISPRYYGLFNPAVHFAGVVADLLTAVYNPQVGGWFHSPAATEIEQYTLRTLARLAGIDRPVSAHFTSGGSEANLTAVLAALAHRFPEYRTGGVAAIKGRPLLFVSAEAHHSFWKTAQHTGIGRDAVRIVGVDEQLRMQPGQLRQEIRRARDKGNLPFLVVATAGTTAAGVIDPLVDVAGVCRDEDVWFHVDAAWGGGCLLSPTLRHYLDGVR